MKLFKSFCTAFIVSSVISFLIFKYVFGQAGYLESAITALATGLTCGATLVVQARKNAAASKGQ